MGCCPFSYLWHIILVEYTQSNLGSCHFGLLFYVTTRLRIRVSQKFAFLQILLFIYRAHLAQFLLI